MPGIWKWNWNAWKPWLFNVFRSLMNNPSAWLRVKGLLIKGRIHWKVKAFKNFSFEILCIEKSWAIELNFFSHPFSHGNGSGMHPPIQHTALDRATVPAIQHTALDRAGRPDSCHQCGAGTYVILTNAIASAPRKVWCRDIWDFDKCSS